MRDLIEAKMRLVEDGRITVFGYVRGNALDFGRILTAQMPRLGVEKMKRKQSGDFHVAGATMFKLSADEGTIEHAISEATMKSRGSFTVVKRYMSWVPGFLDDVEKE